MLNWSGLQKKWRSTVKGKWVALTADTLKTFLHDQLITQPFGTLEEAQAAWQQLDNRLILLDPHDDPYTIRGYRINRSSSNSPFPR
jgi:hypothetical protein